MKQHDDEVDTDGECEREHETNRTMNEWFESQMKEHDERADYEKEHREFEEKPNYE